MIDDALTPDCRSSIKNCGTVRPLAFRSQIWTSDYSNPRYGNFLCGNPPGKHRDMPIQCYEFELGF
jgi:hypothetical protein